MLYYYDLLKELPSSAAVVVTGIGEADGVGDALAKGSAVIPTTKVVGWGGGVGKRRIPIEQLREILKEQGSPWAKELEETYQEAEKVHVVSKGKKREVLNEVLEEVSDSIVAPIDWTPILVSIRAAAEATRATLAIKHAEAALRALREERDQDEEDTELLMQWFFDG